MGSCCISLYFLSQNENDFVSFMPVGIFSYACQVLCGLGNREEKSITKQLNLICLTIQAVHQK